MTSLEERTTQEVLARHILLFVMCVTGSWLNGLLFPILWIAIYSCTSVVSWVLLRRLALHRGLLNYVAALAIYAVRVAIFRAMILYLWFFPDPTAQFIALFMLMGSLRFSINPKSRIRSYALITALGDLTTLVVLAGVAVTPAPLGLGRPLVGFAAIGLSVYYVITLRQAHQGLLDIEALEEQSRQSQKMEAIGRLTGGVAHDFNNILTVVNGNLELVEEITDPEEQRKLLAEARAASERASRLTAQLLAFSRQTPMRRELVETRGFLSGLEELTSRVLPAHITVTKDIDADIWPMFVDRAQLEAALLNLIINARDAMPSGGHLALTADCETLSAPVAHMSGTRFVILSLADTGHGIPETLLEKVTEPFFTTKSVGEGSGLGLSMVKGFAEQSGGDLRVTSQVGTGTTVAIWLPAAQQEETASDTPSPPAEPDI